MTNPQTSAILTKWNVNKPNAFVRISIKEIPRLMVEVKTSERTLSANLVYFHEKYGLPGVQVVADLRHEEHRLGLKVVQALPWLEALPDLDWTTPLAQTP